MIDQEGAQGKVRGFVDQDVVVELEGGAEVVLPAELLHPDDHGGYAILARWDQFPARAPDRIQVPVLEEQLAVGVRRVQRESVRVHRRVVVEDKQIETPVWREHVLIDRVPRDELVDRIPETRRDGDTLIVPCVEEVTVVERRLRLREELRIRVVRERTVEKTTVQLRRHEIDIEREGDGASHPSTTNQKKQ